MATISKRKTVVTDPEGNKITTKTRKTNIFGPKGATKVITKYANPVSSGKKRDVKYTDAPVPSDEELGIKEKGGVTKMYKTGGMVNANAKIAAAKKATGRSGGTTKAISKVAVKSASPKGRVGGTSTAPKKALPKAQFGAIMKAGKMLNKISQAPGGKTVIGGGLAAGILGLNKLGSNKSSSKPKGTKAGKSVMSKVFPTISKSKMGGMKGKSC